jgi:transposase
VIERVAATRALGGTVWFEDETALREFPPLRSAWARQGQQAIVVISGKNARRVVHGALDVSSGQFVSVVRERSRGADTAALLAALGQHQPDVPKLVVWDNAPAHQARVAREAAAAAGVELAWLPFRSPELNPCEDLWRPLKAAVAANRAYPSVEDLAKRATTWLQGLTPEERCRTAGLRSSKFQWLST